MELQVSLEMDEPCSLETARQLIEEGKVRLAKILDQEGLLKDIQAFK